MAAARWAAAAIVTLLVSGIRAAGARLAGDAEHGPTIVAPPAAAALPTGAPAAPVAVAPALVPVPTTAPAPPSSAVPPVAPVPSIGPAARPGETLALVVGIDDYPGRRFDLDYAGADATSVDAALATFGVPAANRFVLRDGEAHRAALVAAIGELAQRAGSETTLVIAFAGHVRRLDRHTEAMVASDGELLTDRGLADLLAPARGRRWLLMATCYGGGFTEAIGPGDVLTASAPAGGVAYESSDVGGTHLVHHMVREGWLEGRAGPSVQEAFAYADARLAATRPDRRPVQYDPSGVPLRLGAPASSGPGGPPPQVPSPQPPPPAPSPTTTVPDRRCTLVVLCRGG